MKKIAVIGSGFSGLAASTVLAKAGFEVTVFEKNATPGGRARKFEACNFVFDMGPSWYWMPDVFENYFSYFNKTPSDYYRLKRLDPSYRVYFGKDNALDIPADVGKLCELFDTVEPGSGRQLTRFLHEGKYKYALGLKKMAYKPGLSLKELADVDLLKTLFMCSIFQSFSSHMRKYFKEPKITSLLGFPILFLGAAPRQIPALYSFMNYVDMVLGTWYPMGGMHKVVEGLLSLAKEHGVKFEFQNSVERLEMNDTAAKGIHATNGYYPADYVLASADYHHVEQQLMTEKYRRYSARYWDTRKMAPSCLIFYLGLNKRIEKLLHHTLFFDRDFSRHVKDLFQTPAWPASPLFYVSCPSKTDSTVAPEGCENLMILIPVAAGLKDEETVREKYFDAVMERMENILGEKIKAHILFKRSYAHKDFMNDYNAYKGNAYGLANTLWQTANGRPKIASKKIKNIFYAGQLTVPGPGIPPSLISGMVTARELMKQAMNG